MDGGNRPKGLPKIVCASCGHKTVVPQSTIDKIVAWAVDPKPSPYAEMDGYTVLEKTGSASFVLLNRSQKLSAVVPDWAWFVVKPLLMMIGCTMPVTVIAQTAALAYGWSPLIPNMAFLGTMTGSFIWGCVYYVYIPHRNMLQQEPEGADDGSEPSSELSPRSLAWEITEKTDGGFRKVILEPPEYTTKGGKRRQVSVWAYQDMALAIVNNGFQWVSETKLNELSSQKIIKRHIGRDVFRAVRTHWEKLGLVEGQDDNSTTINNRHGFRVIALEQDPH